MTLSKKDQLFLLKLSRKALEFIFKTGTELSVKDSDIPAPLFENKATFVTLTKHEELRGCIGKLIPQKELYKDVLENTYSAAFADPRFPQLSKDELKDLRIEISVLDKPKELHYENVSDLVQKLEKGKPGVILEFGLNSATFLPQVWEDLPTADEFLSHLCRKAGLSADTWKKEKMNIQIYSVLKFSESNV
jgi:AmmeMemoRadiSam system protein A